MALKPRSADFRVLFYPREAWLSLLISLCAWPFFPRDRRGQGGEGKIDGSFLPSFSSPETSLFSLFLDMVGLGLRPQQLSCSSQVSSGQPGINGLSPLDLLSCLPAAAPTTQATTMA